MRSAPQIRASAQTTPGFGGDLFVTDQYLYWTTRDLALTQGGAAAPGTIQRANLDGTNMMTLITDLIFPQSLVVTNDYLYWADMYAGKIQRANLAGAGKTDLIVGLSSPVGLAVVAGSVPEPGTLALFSLGFAFIGCGWRKLINQSGSL